MYTMRMYTYCAYYPNMAYASRKWCNSLYTRLCPRLFSVLAGTFLPGSQPVTFSPWLSDHRPPPSVLYSTAARRRCVSYRTGYVGKHGKYHSSTRTWVLYKYHNWEWSKLAAELVEDGYNTVYQTCSWLSRVAHAVILNWASLRPSMPERRKVVWRS